MWGSPFGSNVWHSNDKYRKVLWQCNYKYKNKTKCNNTHLSDADLKTISLDAINKLLTNKDEIIENCKLILENVLDKGKLKNKEIELSSELSVVFNLIGKIVQENSLTIQNQKEYEKKYNDLSSRYYSLKEQLEKTRKIIEDKHIRKKNNIFLEILKSQENLVTEFSSEIFSLLVDYIVVYSTDKAKVIFKDGNEMLV